MDESEVSLMVGSTKHTWWFYMCQLIQELDLRYIHEQGGLGMVSNKGYDRSV